MLIYYDINKTRYIFDALFEHLCQGFGEHKPPSPWLRRLKRGVAQLVSVPALGAGGRQFESDHPDK